MGHKKKLSASRSKSSSSSTPPSSTVNQTSSSSTPPPPSDDITAALLASTLLKQGNHTKAQRIVKESFSKHKNSPILHRLNSEIQFIHAYRVDDSKAKRKQLNNAGVSAQRATTLSPNTLSFSLFYAIVLVHLSRENKEYHKVLQECIRGLSIENPDDTLNDTLMNDSNLSLESRMELKRKQIRVIMNRMCAITVIDVEDGEERIKFRRNVEYQRKRDGELMELIKKNEKKIKEFENKMEKARILRRHLELDLEFNSRNLENKLKEIMKFVGLEKIEANISKTEKVRKYWNNRMSDESKKRLLEVRIDDLKQHFDKNEAAREVLMEAIGYAKENRTWKFWECCSCGEKFVDCEAWLEHYEIEHVGMLSKELKDLVPGGVNDQLVDIIVGGDWRPVDTLAATEIKKTRSRVDQWPLSNDTERATILDKIRRIFRLLLTNDCLAVSLLTRMADYACKKLPEILRQDQKLECLRFLGVSELNDALQFLREVRNLCDLTGLIEDQVSDNKALEIMERLSLSSDFKCLLLDDRLLQRKPLPVMCENDVLDDDSAVTSDVYIAEYDNIVISDHIIDWLFLFTPIEEKLASWTQLRGERHGGTEVFEVLDTEFFNLKRLCERKCHLYYCNEALDLVDDICNDEVKKMTLFPESEPQSYASLLRERQIELIERDGDAVFRSTQFQLAAIRDVLEEALSLCFISEEFVKNDDCVHQANRYVRQAIRRKKARQYDELAKVDAMILRRVAALRQFKLKVRLICAYDYLSIMLPLLKLFIQAHLEDLVDKDASEKANAAQETILAELALDAKMNISKGGDPEKQTQQKSDNKKSNKKKKKNRRKPKEFKATGGDEHLLLDQEDIEQVDVPVASVSADQLEEQGEELTSKTTS